MTSNGLKHEASLTAWKAKVCACRSSGMSVSAWCREQGFTTTTYYKWERRVLHEAELGGVAPAALPPSPVFAELPALASTPEKRIVATVRFGAASVDVYSGADTELITALCRALSHAD